MRVDYNNFSTGAGASLNKGKRLIIMRHGDDKNLPNLQRQVSESVAQLIQSCPSLKIDAVIHSPTKRTRDITDALITSLFKYGHCPLILGEFSWLEEQNASDLHYDGLRKKIAQTEEPFQTVFIVSHSTTGPLIARALNANHDDWVLACALSEYAGMLILDLPISQWKEIDNKTKSSIVKAVRPDRATEPNGLSDMALEYHNSL